MQPTDDSKKKMYLFILVAITFVNGDRIVPTNNGPVRGTSVDGKKVEAFLGIPYAEPPVGPLRFAKPVPKSSWKETYDANELPPSCVQLRMGKFYFFVDPESNMDEDCLYLNLWIPEGGSKQKTIMLFIHGGGFMFGSSNMEIYDGAALSERGDVIVATLNYRVGTLGFFSGFIEDAAGNMGLYDQLMAIKWIKDNAEHFGGDPDNILLFGESAGAFSTSLHMVSPLSRNLFKRVILQSGSAFNPAYSDGNEGLFLNSQFIANQLGCAEDNESLKRSPKDVVDCMKTLPAEKFSEVDLIAMQNVATLLPRVGDDFLPVNPIDLFRKGEFKDTELLLGITRDEGSILVATLKRDIFGAYGEKVDASSFNETLTKEILQDVMRTDVSENPLIQSYLERVKDESKYTYLDAMSDVVGDFMVTCSTIFHADFQSVKANPVYFYLFDYRSSKSPLSEWMGVAHFDEVQYVFGTPINGEFTKNDEKVSNDVMDMWVAFAKTGNPSLPGGLKWPRYTYEDPKYFIIGERDSMGVRPDNHRCDALRNAFRAVLDDDTIRNLKNHDEL